MEEIINSAMYKSLSINKYNFNNIDNSYLKH